MKWSKWDQKGQKLVILGQKVSFQVKSGQKWYFLVKKVKKGSLQGKKGHFGSKRVILSQKGSFLKKKNISGHFQSKRVISSQKCCLR